MNPLRPLVLTHAGDGSDRVFVATEHGVIHVFPNDQKAAKTKVFLDIQDRVVYDDNQNEEGFLGLTFHPDYKKNGEFFVFYTTKKAKLLLSSSTGAVLGAKEMTPHAVADVIDLRVGKRDRGREPEAPGGHA